jgi:hypothetical protein
VEVFTWRRRPATARFGHVRFQRNSRYSQQRLCQSAGGQYDGVFGMACTGDAPLSGTAKIPGQVVTHFGVNDTQLRIVQTNGVALTGTVRLSCVIEVDLTPEGAATMDRLRAAAGAG